MDATTTQELVETQGESSRRGIPRVVGTTEVVSTEISMLPTETQE